MNRRKLPEVDLEPLPIQPVVMHDCRCRRMVVEAAEMMIAGMYITNV